MALSKRLCGRGIGAAAQLRDYSSSLFVRPVGSSAIDLVSPMAFRIHDSVVRGEIDNRMKGAVRGSIWLEGRAEPLTLELHETRIPIWPAVS